MFPQYENKLGMLIGFLVSLEFCHIIDSETVNIISRSTTSSSTTEQYLYFPSLVTIEPPPSIRTSISNGYGWCIWCPYLHQFLSTRFLHVLLLRLPFTYCLPHRPLPGQVITNQHTKELARECTIWNNGIYWKHEYQALVEVSEHNRCVTILVSKGLKGKQVFSLLIREVLKLQEDLSPCAYTEYIISPIKDACVTPVSQHVVYELQDVARATLVRSWMDTEKDVVKDIGAEEPYLFLVPVIIKDLFDKSKEDEVFPDGQIHQICCDVIAMHKNLSCSQLTYLDVRNILNKFSTFAGRNPLVSTCTTYITTDKLTL